jgi:hypothetical protein
VNAAALIRYCAAKVASAAAHRVDKVRRTRDKAVAIRRPGGVLRDAVVQAPSFEGAKLVLAPAITDIICIYTDLAANCGITIPLNGSGATGHHTRRAACFVRHRQRPHHRGINNDLYPPPHPRGSGAFAPPPLS